MRSFKCDRTVKLAPYPGFEDKPHRGLLVGGLLFPLLFQLNFLNSFNC
jgi:hypothetical protein